MDLEDGGFEGEGLSTSIEKSKGVEESMGSVVERGERRTGEGGEKVKGKEKEEEEEEEEEEVVGGFSGFPETLILLVTLRKGDRES